MAKSTYFSMQNWYNVNNRAKFHGKKSTLYEYLSLFCRVNIRLITEKKYDFAVKGYFLG